MSEAAGQRLKAARIARGFKTAAAAAEAFGWNRNTYSSNENGNASFSFRRAREYADAFGVDALLLYEGAAGVGETTVPAPSPLRPEGVLVPVVGEAGAQPGGLVRLYDGTDVGDLAPLPPGGTERAIAVRVGGRGLGEHAEPGALLYFEDARSRPDAACLGAKVFVGEERGGVRLGVVLRGEKPGRFDLVCAGGETLYGRKFSWAEHVTAIIPPHQASRLVRRG